MAVHYAGIACCFVSEVAVSDKQVSFIEDGGVSAGEFRGGFVAQVARSVSRTIRSEQAIDQSLHFNCQLSDYKLLTFLNNCNFHQLMDSLSLLHI